MKTLLFSSILITLFACGNDKATVSKDPKSADTAIVKSDQVAPQKEIKQLPQIALYANEIGIPDESMGRGKELKFILKGEQLVLENSDESSFEYQENTNIISIKERSGGTGSEYTWNTTFRLLGEAPFPTVICLKRESEEIFLGPQNRRDIDELAFELAAEANEPEEDWYEVATMMVDRNDQTTYLQDPTSLGGYDSYSVSISAFQKREGKWEQLENILPTDFKERCTKFFPINELNSANLIEINNI